MKTPLAASLASLVLLTPLSGAFGAVLFSANYDTSFDAQTTPGASPTPTVVEAGSNPISITTGSQGYGGSGEALLAPDNGDTLIYSLGPLNNAAWFPSSGRVTMDFKVNQADTGQWINMFAFTYGSPGLDYLDNFAVFLGQGQVGGWAQVVGSWAGTANYYNNGTVAGSPNPLPGSPMSTIGWHTLEVDWSTVGAYAGGNTALTLDVSVYVDGQLGLHVPNAVVGAPQYMDELQVGSWTMLGARSIGEYGSGLYDQISIEDTSAVPEPASLGLLAIGGLLMLRRRKA